jgi:hypothetical protein
VHRQVEHLVEVAVVQRAVVANRERVAAHHPAGRGGVERRHQPLHVGVERAALLQELQEARDGHVGDRVERAELDVVEPRHLRFHSASSIAWLPGRKVPDRVGHQVQQEARPRLAVAQRVELLQRRDGLLEDAVAALRIRPFWRKCGSEATTCTRCSAKNSGR